FCLSSQNYLIKKSVKSFFIDVATLPSTININESYAQVFEATNKNPQKLGLVRGLPRQLKSTHPFIDRFNDATQSWLFIKHRNDLQVKKFNFTNDDKSKQQLIDYCKN